MAPPARAENVLQRAEELVKMDKASSALELLYDTINSKRLRYVSLDTQEPLILKFIELSVDLRAGKNVRDALHQFKKLTVATNPQSFALAIDTFLSGCRRKAKEAQAEANAIEVDEDLEAEQSPEDLLLATISSEQSKDRTDREVVTPWLKFLWEGYRSVLDVLRNNNKLETLYAKTVSQAFQFCLEYNRKTEFRRLCELLRNHLLQAAQKQQPPTQTNPIDINDPETLQMLIGIRFEQLKGAVKLELWQEAFRSIEGLHSLLVASRRPIKIPQLAIYYETLAKISGVSENHLFHAASWAKYYGMVYNSRETAPKGEIQRIASVFYLSCMCIPGDAGASITPGSNRLTALLNMGRVPTRDSLISFALSKNILNYVRPEIRELNSLLEADFHPLTLKKRLEPIFTSLGELPEFASYIKPLLEVVVNRTFLQLAQSYTTVKMDFIVDILPGNLDRFEVEKMLVLATHRNFLKVRINHQKGSVSFLDSLSVQEASSVEDVLQPTPASLVRNRLRDLATCFSEVLPQVDEAEQKRVTKARKDLLGAAERGLAKENAEFLNRKKLQHERQERAQQEARKHEIELAKQRSEQSARDAEAERERQQREAVEAEQALFRKEQKAMEDAKKTQLIQEINAKGGKIDIEDIDKHTLEALRSIQIDQLSQEADDVRTRMRNVARKQDHLERALRIKEAELWTEDAEKQKTRDKKAYEVRTTSIVAAAKAQFETLQSNATRFERIIPEYRRFIGEIAAKRQAAYEAKKAENDKLFEEAKAARIEQEVARLAKEEQARKDEEERRARWAKQAEEEAAAQEARKAEADAKANVYRPGLLRANRPAAAASAPAPAARAPARSSPFGNAKPVSSSPFGSAKPVSARPEGAATPAAAPAPKPAAARVDPFGRSKGKPASSPFGNAVAKSTGDSAGASSGSAPAPKKGAYVPPSLRKK